MKGASSPEYCMLEPWTGRSASPGKETPCRRRWRRPARSETLIDNEASQRVLLKNGFVQYGRAPEYLEIAGRWQEHLLFQVTFPSTDAQG